MQGISALCLLGIFFFISVVFASHLPNPTNVQEKNLIFVFAFLILCCRQIYVGLGIGMHISRSKHIKVTSLQGYHLLLEWIFRAIDLIHLHNFRLLIELLQRNRQSKNNWQQKSYWKNFINHDEANLFICKILSSKAKKSMPKKTSKNWV